MQCALVSRGFDLRDYYGKAFDKVADRIQMQSHPADDPAEVRMAVAWHPPADAFDRYPNLQAVCTIGAGADNVLACPSLRPGIDVVRVVDPAQAEMMSGFITWHVIWHQRRFASYLAQQRRSEWRRLPQRAARSVPVALLGYGQIGSRVAADLTQLGFPVLAWSRTPKSMPPGMRGFHGGDGLFAMLREAEVLVNLLPLTPETRGILNRDVFAALQPGGYLIQVGRGEHLAEADLLAALDSGQLAGASLDVFAREPLAGDHVFWQHPKIVLTPHDACDVSNDALVGTLLSTAEAIETGRRPPGAVDRVRGY
ncbi:glyoxylate/hydroxypyruvate reductase A [Ferrovibrio sp.]|uniref:2-hydroxyacid dehydrogenase n=1 Tax=Ferrovibrio sp. TaxID=1917215 RepID=UPI00311EDFE3